MFAAQSLYFQEISISNEASAPSPRSVGPRSIQDILMTQLDIIYTLARAGADPASKDEYGYTASYRACKQMETTFLEGAFLLGLCVE